MLYALVPGNDDKECLKAAVCQVLYPL